MAPSARVLQWRIDTESGDAQAAEGGWFQLANAYFEGDEGLAQNKRLAVKMFIKAAELDHCGAMTSLGSLYSSDDLLLRDFALAVHWYRKAAEVTCRCEKGHSLDQCYLATFLVSGVGCERDIPLALHWYRVAAAAGQKEAQGALGRLYYEGLVVKKNLKSAVCWFAKSAAHGYGPAIYFMGKCHRDGAGVRQDDALAVEWWYKGADCNDQMSLLMLGTAFMKGTCGLPQNTVCGKIYMKGAAEHGNPEAIKLLKVLRACVSCGRSSHYSVSNLLSST